MDLLHNSSVPFAGLTIERLHLSFTICFTVFHSLIFLIAYIQLWLVLYLNHKLVSTQTVYFLLCSIFTSERIVLFCFFYNKKSSEIKGILRWLLYDFPIVIHYMIVLLITVFYYRQYIKSKGHSSKLNRSNWIVISVLIFIVFNIQLLAFWLDENIKVRYYILLIIKNIGTDLIFMATISVFIHIYRQFPKFPNALLVQEAKRITKSRSIIVGLLCLSVPTMKLLYDITAIITIIVNIQSMQLFLSSTFKKRDFISSENNCVPFLIFGIVLFSWEVLPLIAAMIIFRVRFPKGIFENLKPTLQKVGHSNTASNSIAANSASTTKSKFIGVPKYGTLTNSADTSSGAFSPDYYENPHVFPYSIQRYDGNIFEPCSTTGRFLQSNIHTDSCNITRDGFSRPRSYKQSAKNFLRKNKPQIWKSSSNRCLTSSNTFVKGPVAKANSTYLATANEE